MDVKAPIWMDTKMEDGLTFVPSTHQRRRRKAMNDCVAVLSMIFAVLGLIWIVTQDISSTLGEIRGEISRIADALEALRKRGKEDDR